MNGAFGGSRQAVANAENNLGLNPANLYVAEWISDGRVTKLRRTK